MPQPFPGDRWWRIGRSSRCYGQLGRLHRLRRATAPVYLGVFRERMQLPVVTEVVSNFERSWSLLTAPECCPPSHRPHFRVQSRSVQKPLF